MRQLGGSFGIAVTSAVFTVSGGYGSTAAVQHGFRAAVLAAAESAALGALAGLGVARHRRSAAMESARPAATAPELPGTAPQLPGTAPEVAQARG
ncbi:hypothetical protein ACWELJ_26670 [Nocardia sp. NPDC004582]